MASRYLLLSAAGIALVAASGAAQAADIIPIMAPTVAVMDPGPVPTGPDVSIEISKWLDMYYEPGYPVDFETHLDFDIDILTASGWGFELIGGDWFELELPIYGGAGVTARVYRAFGDIEIGLLAGIGTSIPFGMGYGYGFGFDFSYEAEKLTVENETWFNFQGGGGFQGFETDTTVTFDASEALSLNVGLLVSHYGSPSYYSVYGGVAYEIGDFTPYADIWWAPGFGEWGGDIGVDFEHQIGTGPLSLVANTEFDFGTYGRSFYAGIGIKFTRGGD